MMRRFLAAFGLVLLYMLVIAVILLPITLLARENDKVMVFVLLGTLVFCFATIVPYINYVARRVFRFKGEGKPVSEKTLRAEILRINEFDAPVMIVERRNKVIATWKYVDARWWEILAKAGLTKIYELHIKFDEAQHLATLIDVTKSVAWRAGPTEVRVSGGFIRGITLEFEIGKQWGIKENFELGMVYDYRFSTREIKTPIMNSILRSGWDVCFAMW